LDDQLDWLDRLRAEANVPERVDLDNAALIHNNVSDDDVSPITYSRWPIPYIILGRERRYLVSDVVAYAKQRVEQAPRRNPPQRPRKKRVRTAAPKHELVAPAEHQHQPATQPEKRTEPAS
jgi:hypothetical protein